MPQLVKGGKFVYGLSRINPDGIIVIPPVAMDEYGCREGDRVIGISGSRKSGGLGLTKKSLLEKSALNVFIRELPGLLNFTIPEGEIIASKGRLFCWTLVRSGGCVCIPLPALSGYGLEAGNLLVVARGSYLSIAFVARGPIFQEALRHPELEIFGE